MNCRSCGHSDLKPVLDLGETPLANSLLTSQQLDKPEPRFQLEVVVCTKCALAQLVHLVPPEELFTEYAYFSSFSDTMLQFADAVSSKLIKERNLNASSLVLEVASNDGYLLQYYHRKGVSVLGVEPARNIAEVAVGKGIPTRTEFFSSEYADKLASEGIAADVIHCNNVMAHVPEINGFVTGLRKVLKDDGVVVIEVPYVRNMIEDVEFDTIYHEHVFYFSLTALVSLFGNNGLQIVDVEQLPIHGGSLRIFAQKTGTPSRAVTSMLEAEREIGLDGAAAYESFAHRVVQLKQNLVAMLHELKNGGAKVAAYGAAAKGSTLLNYMGIGTDILDFVADRSTVKQGKYMPGAHLPIVAPTELMSRRPDYVLLLTWNFADEILQQQRSYLEAGGKFILPVPRPRIVSKSDVAVKA